MYEDEMDKLKGQIEIEKKKSVELERRLENSKNQNKQHIQEFQDLSVLSVSVSRSIVSSLSDLKTKLKL